MLAKELNPFERFTDLFHSGDDRQDMMITLLYEIAVLLAGQEPPPEAPGLEFPKGLAVAVPLGIQSVDLMANIEALTTDVIFGKILADCRKALRTMIIVNNGFNQTVAMQVVGHTANTPKAGTFQIGSAINVTAGSKAAYGIKIEEWMPFIGVEVTPAVSPTTGSVNAVAILQIQGEVLSSG